MYYSFEDTTLYFHGPSSMSKLCGTAMYPSWSCDNIGHKCTAFSRLYSRFLRSLDAHLLRGLCTVYRTLVSYCLHFHFFSFLRDSSGVNKLVVETGRNTSQ